MSPVTPPEGPLMGRVVRPPQKNEPVVVQTPSGLHQLPPLKAGEQLQEGDWLRWHPSAPAQRERLGGPQRAHVPSSLSSAKTGAPPPGDSQRWLRPLAQGRSRMDNLVFRGQALGAIRQWFARQGFVEAETPALVKAPSPEPQFAPFSTQHDYLITSPEFQLKRMVVGGFQKVYRLGPVFRGDEAGPLHNPEFTLLEWYRAGEGLEALAQDLEALVGLLAPLAPAASKGRLKADPALWHLDAPGRQSGSGQAAPVSIPLEGPFERASVAALFERHLGLALPPSPSLSALRQAAQQAGLPLSPTESYEEAFFELWNRFEHKLGIAAPLLVEDWPAPLASLARLKPGAPHLAERMELYLAGVELSNGFDELTDPEEQRARFKADLALRRERAMAPVPLDEAFLAALDEGLPRCAGMALGVDRLVMLLAGAASIQEVMAFGWTER